MLAEFVEVSVLWACVFLLFGLLTLRLGGIVVVGWRGWYVVFRRANRRSKADNNGDSESTASG